MKKDTLITEEDLEKRQINIITSSKISVFSKNVAVITADQNQYSYSQLIDYTKLISEKIVQRSLVFCLSENSIGSLVGYLSFITKILSL